MKYLKTYENNHQSRKEMLEKAKEQLENIDINSSIENNTLYVIAGYDTKLELSDYEIEYRANLFDEEVFTEEHYDLVEEYGYEKAKEIIDNNKKYNL